MRNIHERIRVWRMTVVELLQIKPNSLTILKSLLHTNVQTKLATASLSLSLNSYAVNLCSFSSVPSLLLMMDTTKLSPLSTTRLDNKAEPMSKCPTLKPGVPSSRGLDNLAFKWRLAMRRKQSSNSLVNLGLEFWSYRT